MKLKVKRVYEPAAKEDGRRVLVDRMWPRGVRKDDAEIDLWLRDIAPSSELRSWFGHDPERCKEFFSRYHEELARKPEPLARLLELLNAGTVTLLYAAKDERCNNAVALMEYLLKHC